MHQTTVSQDYCECEYSSLVILYDADKISELKLLGLCSEIQRILGKNTKPYL